jgi:hypothetical protein
MALVQNFNVNPYYDDYDEDKKFLRMLFRPGYAVQARELTQLQTILQKQVSRFGKHIFKNGSVVTGGEVSISTSAVYHKLRTTTTSGADIDVNTFLNRNIGTAASLASNSAIGRVVAVSEATTIDPPTIFVEYKTALQLQDGETFFTIDNDQYEGRLIVSSSTGKTSTASVNDGIYFIDDFFVKVTAQTIILNKYDNAPTFRVGLAYEESIVDERTDTSLLDPALNASNYQAPGATRYKVNLGLTTRSIDSVDDTKFIEIIRIESGIVTLRNSYPIYAELERTLARRTYDESGNYTVKPFTIYLKDHIPDVGNTSNSSQFTAKLSTGKAYVRGYEIETVSPINLTLDRAREKAGVNNYDIAANYGNYIQVSNTKGFFDTQTMGIIDLHCVPSSSNTYGSRLDVVPADGTHDRVDNSNTTTYNSTKIGTARIREIEYVSAANTLDPSSYIYNLYFYDTRFTSITANSGASGNSNHIVLSATAGAASNVANAYYGAYIRISGGHGADNVKHFITQYNNVNKTVRIADTFAVVGGPRANSIYSIDFNVKDVDSFVDRRLTGTNDPYLPAANVTLTNKDSRTQIGNTFTSDTNFKSLVFRVPQSFVSFGMSDQDFRGSIVYKNQIVSGGSLTLSTGSANNVFVGSGVLSDAQAAQHFFIAANTGSTGFNLRDRVPITAASGRSVTVSGDSVTINFNSSNIVTADVMASVDFNTTSPKTKTLVSANTTGIGTSGTTIGSTTVYLSDGQVAISSPNKIPGQSDNLYISDIYKLEGTFEETYGYFNITSGGNTYKSSFKVVDSGSTGSAVVAADLTNAAKDITDRYILNDGQDDGFYDHGFITLRPGATPPRGQILILINYFTHTGSGYFSVDSYNNSSLGATEDIRYAKIPNFTSPITGEIFKLRDCIDFRPIRTNASSASPNFTLSGISLPRAGESLESDYTYYISRIDRIVLGEDKKFRVIKGISALYPQTPAEPDNAMSLYTLRINPYTFFPTDNQLRYIENKRYTMRDIGKLEKRIENLEYYTALNTLEKSAQDLTVLDSNGLERFKNGILTDSFRGHQVGDVKNFDYRCAMDFEAGELRPPFVTNSIGFTANSSQSTANVEAGTIIVSPYTVKTVITQNVATQAIAVNPFVLSNYAGTLDFFPPGDFWIDTEQRPDVLVNLEGENDAWEQIGAALHDTRAAGWGNQWGEWNEYVSGKSTTVGTGAENRSVGYLDYQDTVRSTTTVTQYSKERYGTKKVLVPERIVRSIGNRQVDLSVVPYIRAQWIITVAKGLRPNQYHYLFAEQGDLDATKYIEYPAIAWLFNVSGDFNDSYGIYETVTSSSGGTAKLLKQTGRSWSQTQPMIFLGDVRGTFAANDTVTGAVSGATAKIDIMFWNNGNTTTANATTITLGSGAPVNNAYVNVQSTYATVTWPYSGTKNLTDPITATQFYQIRIVAGTGLGQERTITNYNGSTKIASITPAWDVVPDSTSRWSVGKPQTDDHGDMPGRWYLPNYGPTTYDDGWRSRTGARLIRLTNDPNNDPTQTNSFAEEQWYAQGVLNVVEEVSVSVRVPTIQNQVIYEKNENYRSTTAVQREILGTTLVRDRTPPPSRGGGGGKIICSEMAQQGFFAPDINEADQRFGRRLQRNHPIIYRGYVYWARTIVEWLKGRGPSLYLWDMKDNNEMQRNIALHMTEVIARPWSDEMAYVERVRDEGSLVGKLVFWLGLVICAIVGLTNPNLSKPDSRLKGFTIFTFMIAFYILVSIINIVTSPFKVIKEYFKSKLIRN